MYWILFQRIFDKKFSEIFFFFVFLREFVLIIIYKIGKYSSDVRISQDNSLILRIAKYAFKNKKILNRKTLLRE